jgi:hypothetical protein
LGTVYHVQVTKRTFHAGQPLNIHVTLVFRRARAAKSLLLAATGATLIATVLLTGLADYSRDVVDAGARSAILSSAPDERSVLVQGPAGSPTQLSERDRTLRDKLAGGLAGFDTQVIAAGYATGRQLSGDTGGAVPNADGVVFASVLFLEGLPEHADLVAGAWPQPGAAPVQATLAEAAAATLRAEVGDPIEITDRLSKKVGSVMVSGIWRPRDLTDPFWLLVPGVADGQLPSSSTYGPLVVTPDDFRAGFATTASAAWLIEPDLVGADVAGLQAARRDANSLTTNLATEVGFGSSGLVTSRIDQLADRQERADLVGRSALVTPMLLMVVLGGYALMLVAGLLNEHRRGETALLRARGAARVQLAGLAIRESALVVLPAAALAPILATEVLRQADRAPVLTEGVLQLAPRLDALTWLVAAAAATGCALAMVGPSLRRGSTYVAELAARSRPTRWAAAQRVGFDLALIGLAVLGWVQLRQYSSPLTSAGLGIDPLLAATPTLGVLAGAVVALRVLPPVTRFAERYVARRNWTATVLGMWQAGRRPQAGPVLLLALAVAVSTLAWCLASTAEQSQVDQVDHQVGADLRLTELGNLPPDGRAEQVTKLPGVAAAASGWRESLRQDGSEEETSVVVVDTRAARDVMRARKDIAPGGLFAGMEEPVDAPTVDLPAGDRLTGEVVTGLSRWEAPPFVVVEPPVATEAVFATATGYHRVPLGQSRTGQPLRFSIDLATFQPAKLAGFLVDTRGASDMIVNWQVRSLRVGAAAVDLPGAGPWQARDRSGGKVGIKPDLSIGYESVSQGGWGINSATHLVVTRQRAAGTVPLVATPEALAGLRMGVGDKTRLTLGQSEVDVRVAGSVAAVPGTAGASAMLVDRAALAAEMFYEHGTVRQPQEWWLATRPGEHAVAADAAAKLAGMEVLDRVTLAADAGRDPYGVGARAALFAAALGAILLAGTGVGVEMRATARRRVNELAVLHTLGAGPRLLARSLLAEQVFLAGIGVLAGAAVGIAVAATMAPLVILTPSAARPVPEPLLDIAWMPVLATAAGLLGLTLVLSALVATTVRQRLAAAQLRIGADT